MLGLFFGLKRISTSARITTSGGALSQGVLPSGGPGLRSPRRGRFLRLLKPAAPVKGLGQSRRAGLRGDTLPQDRELPRRPTCWA
jgi:hypothetical protein